MIALTMIVKPTDDEADLLKQCLTNVAPHVDGIFLTITGQNEKCENVAKMFNAHVSHYQWNNDFGSARNFALAQVPTEYSHWFWLDCDDTVNGIQDLKSIVDENPLVDVFVFDYLYWFDEWGNPVVVHSKERVFKHDGSVEWKGMLHEGFFPKRELDIRFVEGIQVVHNSNQDRVDNNSKRNLEVAKHDLETNPEDPRTYWNLGNSYKGVNDNKNAIEVFETFMEKSKSESEKYIALMRMSESAVALHDLAGAYKYACHAIGMRPMWPDAYMLKAEILRDFNRLEEATEHAMMSLKLKPAYHDMLVYNPRDYDLRPLKLLSDLYFARSLPQLALEALKKVFEITPKDKQLESLIQKVGAEAKRSDEVMEFVKAAREMTDEELKEKLDNIDPDLLAHPGICSLRNTRFVRTESSGKDISIVCGYTTREWTAEAVKEGIGGSEEAVINLSKRFAREGWNVTVFNNCGYKIQEFDGVTYKPFWMWNYRDKQDVVVLWRHPRFLDSQINAEKVFVDMHDVIESGEFTEKRIDAVTKVFFKSQSHRRLYPQIPDEKVVIVPNGIEWESLQQPVERDPYLLINTSSPDRSLHTLLKAFEKVKEQVPEAKLTWAYGWGVWDSVYDGDPEKMKWKNDIVEKMETLPGVTNLGRIGHQEVARLYQEASIFAYPTAFYEIDCISARKAQAAGAFPVVTDFAALDETVQYGDKVKVDPEKENWNKPYQFDFALKDEKAVEEWIEKTVEQLKNPISEEKRTEMREWTKQFDWDIIVQSWIKEL